MTDSRIGPGMEAAVDFSLRWASGVAHHEEHAHVPRFVFDRDIVPTAVDNQLDGLAAGQDVNFTVDAEALGLTMDDSDRHQVPRAAFQLATEPDAVTTPAIGRYYPAGFLAGMPGVSEDDRRPARCVGVTDDELTFDLNHPFAGRSGELSVSVGRVEAVAPGLDGRRREWVAELLAGPGRQARIETDVPTDFWEADAFRRSDEAPDPDFYGAPRIVQHIDDRAIQVAGAVYGRLIPAGGSVLDLMSSHVSHLPADLQLSTVAGLGMNEVELNANRRLTDPVVHDLNADPVLPFADETFDAVICTVSVDYLTRPFEVFAEVRRILKKDGVFAVTFSNRWFPTKVVRVWERLQEFERLGLVSEYFLRSGLFRDIHTFSQRGLPRPPDDPYYSQMLVADPVYAVWGRPA